jgi:hypothetical protein
MACMHTFITNVHECMHMCINFQSVILHTSYTHHIYSHTKPGSSWYQHSARRKLQHYVCIYAHTHTHTHTYIYIYIYMHTHTHFQDRAGIGIQPIENYNTAAASIYFVAFVFVGSFLCLNLFASFIVDGFYSAQVMYLCACMTSHVCVCVCVYIYVYIYTYMQVTYSLLRVCACTCLYAYIHINTHFVGTIYTFYHGRTQSALIV